MENNFIRRFISGFVILLLIFLATQSSYFCSALIYTIFILMIYEILQLKKYRIPLVLSFIYLITQIKNNSIDQSEYIYLFLSVSIIDTSSYLIGRSFGTVHFTSISPKKTIEGLIGGMVVFFLIFHFQSLGLNIIIFISSVMGDLFFSLIKRYNKIKDYSAIIPGHGGILDRFDSVIITVCILKILKINLYT